MAVANLVLEALEGVADHQEMLRRLARFERMYDLVRLILDHHAKFGQVPAELVINPISLEYHFGTVDVEMIYGLRVQIDPLFPATAVCVR